MMLPCHHPLSIYAFVNINPLNTKLNPICHLLALLGAHHILHIIRIRVNTAWHVVHFGVFGSLQVPATDVCTLYKSH
jgi:hypothetical protein